MKSEELKDVMPKLGQIIANDFNRFENTWLDILVGYAKVFNSLLDIFMLPSETQEEAVKVIEDYIASRQKPYGQWKSPDWLAYELSQIVERAKKSQEQNRHEPLDDDELPF
jgi:hypothetical protein